MCVEKVLVQLVQLVQFVKVLFYKDFILFIEPTLNQQHGILNQHNVTELMRTTPGWHQRVFYETFVKSCVQGRDVFESEHYEIFVVQKTASEKLLCLFSKPSA
ncbi:putative prophage protein [Escherichia coli]|nr:putative prophage protein [Escherichia coli]